MKYIIRNMFLVGILLFPLGAFAQIETPYKSLDEMCVVEKKDDGYFFINQNEMKTRQREIFGKATRDNFEWFYMYKKDPQDLYYLIAAKVHPQMRDAFIDFPGNDMKVTIKACPLTRDNQRLAASVTYAYTSNDYICACLKESDKINCGASSARLKNAPFRQLLPFFSSGGYPAVIVGVVPSLVFKALLEAPEEYNEGINRLIPCGNNTSNEEIVAEYAQTLGD